MPIETNFRFDQITDQYNINRLALNKVDLLGPLRSFIGDNHTRTWSGPGFNLIWRPHNKAGDNPKDFFLELDVTRDTLSFTNITGTQGIANRGLLQDDIALGGLGYQQEVSDVTRVPRKPLHFEPGVWINVPSTANPAEGPTVSRLGSIPHGATINAQGISLDSPDGKPRFTPSSIKPFKAGSPDDGVTGIVQFPEWQEPLATNLPARTPISEVVGLTDAHFQDPTKILSDVTDGQNILRTKVFVISTNVNLPASSTQDSIPGRPHEGGGTDNIGFLVGSAGGPNANAAQMTATFWVEEVKRADGATFFQLQYIQRILLNFNQLSWPHISLATMVVTAEST